MTDNTTESARNLFVRRWGEMGASWGISRTMAEIHALLFLSPDPLCTDDVMDQLAVSRGSASTNLRELVNWGLIQRVHRRGDRREYFEAERDVWQMFETIIRERRRREVQPIVETIQRCLTMLPAAKSGATAPEKTETAAYRKRLGDILEFCETLDSLFSAVSRAGKMGLRPIIKSLAKLAG